jgi:hypothetical protein
MYNKMPQKPTNDAPTSSDTSEQHALPDETAFPVEPKPDKRSRHMQHVRMTRKIRCIPSSVNNNNKKFPRSTNSNANQER